jgi:hypothetical protein
VAPDEGQTTDGVDPFFRSGGRLSSAIHPDVIEAYRGTDYIVWAESALTLRVGVASDGLADLHRRYGVRSSAFVTACNPFSEVLTEADNVQRQVLLAKEVKWLGLRFLEGIGQHPSNEWPGEPSYLVLGLPLANASELAEKFGQNAMVWADVEAVPQLILLR